jgi:hypothetical protein
MGCAYCKSRKTNIKDKEGNEEEEGFEGVLYCSNAYNQNFSEDMRQYYKDKFSSLCWKKIDSSSSSAS